MPRSTRRLAAAGMLSDESRQWYELTTCPKVRPSQGHPFRCELDRGHLGSCQFDSFDD